MTTTSVPPVNFEPTTKGYHRTDYGNAERIIAEHGDDLRYVHRWRRWLVWDGRRWADDDTGEAVRRAKASVRAIWAELGEIDDEEERKRMASHAMRSEGEARIRASLVLAGTEVGVPVTVDDLDADPWALNVLNGTLDLRAGKLRPHLREDLATKLAPVAWVPGATCPTWMAFLDRIMGGNARLVEFLQRAAGYSLTAETTEQVMFLLHGGGANGKTTFLEALRAMLGDYAQQAPPETLMVKRSTAIPNDVARMRGARFATAVETGEGRRLDEVTVKRLTGGDMISARFMRAEWFDFRPVAKLWLATNHKPTVRGTDDAIWRRLRLVPFEVTIPEAEQDRDLPAKLKAEMAGILAWAVEGCLRWQAEGLGVPDEVREATATYRAAEDVLSAFLGEECRLDETVWTSAGDLYQAYRRWCDSAGERPVSQRKLGEALTERGFRRARQGEKRRWHWQGVELLQREVNP